MQSPPGNNSSTVAPIFDNLTNTTKSTFFDKTTEQVATLLNVYYTPILVALGFIGNLLSVYVFCKSKLWRQSTSQYLSALAISDTVFLIHLLPPWLNAVHLSKFFHYKGLCQIVVFISYASCSLSSWLVVAFTFERFVAVMYPLKRYSICTVKRARFIIMTLIGGALLINVPIFRLVVPKKNDCNVNSEYVKQASRFNVVDTMITFTIPLALIIGLNTCITVGVWKLRQTHERRHRAQYRVTRMLLIVSTVFVLFNLPAYTMRVLVYAYEMSDREYTGIWAAVQQMTLLVFNTNFGINFILYCLAGQNFRKALMQTLFKTKRRPSNTMALRPLGTSQPGTSSVSMPTFGVHAERPMQRPVRHLAMRKTKSYETVRVRQVKKQGTGQQTSDSPFNHRYTSRVTLAASSVETNLHQPTTSPFPAHEQPNRRVPFNLFPLRHIITNRNQTYNAEVAKALYN